MEEAKMDKKDAGKFTKGDFIMMGDKPCKVVKTAKAKPGKHGSAKAIITAVGVLDDKKVEKTFGTSDGVDVPSMVRTEYPCLGLEGEFLQLQQEDGGMREDVKFGLQDSVKEVNENIKKFLENDTPILVTVLNCNGEEVPVAVREDNLDI